MTSTSTPLSRRPATALGIVAIATLLVASGAASAHLSASPRLEPERGADTIRLEPASVDGLRILLTNDDGVQPEDGTGLFQLRQGLCEAGAEVAVVGPWLDQSGSSASITYGDPDTRFTLTSPELDPEYGNDCATEPSGGAVWGACVIPAGDDDVLHPCDDQSTSLTPADAVTLGAHVVQDGLGWTGGPDLVISGTNRGGNDGLNVNISGTLGAATIASSLGYPSIAISASSSGDADANFEAAAEWAVGFVGTLAANDILPANYVLSANHPRVDRGPITDAAWAPVAQMSPFATGYTLDDASDPADGPLHYTSGFAFCDPENARCGDPEPGSDSALYSGGTIAVSPISVNRTVGAPADTAAVEAVVRSGAVSPDASSQPGNKPIVVLPEQASGNARTGR